MKKEWLKVTELVEILINLSPLVLDLGLISDQWLIINNKFQSGYMYV